MVPNSTSSAVPASLLLPQDFSLYIKWQKKYRQGADIGQVSDALEYYRFIKYRDAHVNGDLPLLVSDNPHMVSECGHTCHPSDVVITGLCPVCEVNAHLSFLHAITAAWDKAGGPRLRADHVKGKSYSLIRSRWHTERCRFQEMLDRFAIVADYEKAWEAKHLFEAAAARRTNCASTAIALAQEESRYPAIISPRAPPKQTKEKLAQAKKKVSFSQQVRTKNGKHFSTSATNLARGRPPHAFKRCSSSYQPGVHACPEGSEFINTSQMNDLITSISNSKIYITDDEDAFDRLQGEPSIFSDFVGHYEGILGLHKLSNNVFRVIKDLMAQGVQEKEEMECLIDESDRIAVLIDVETGGVLDVFLFDGVDGEAEDGCYEGSKRNKAEGPVDDWTCLRECMQ